MDLRAADDLKAAPLVEYSTPSLFGFFILDPDVHEVSSSLTSGLFFFLPGPFEAGLAFFRPDVLFLTFSCSCKI